MSKINVKNLKVKRANTITYIEILLKEKQYLEAMLEIAKIQAIDECLIELLEDNPEGNIE